MNKTFRDISFPRPAKIDKHGEMIPLTFYGEVIPCSKKIQFKLGYFSTNAISTLAVGFAQFIYNGGTAEFVINHFVSPNDYNLLASKDEISDFNFKIIESNNPNDIKELAEILKQSNDHFFNCLRYLLKKEKLKIIPVTCSDGKMSHFKEAIFTDTIGNKIYINGSCNFTQAGIIDNGESFVVHRSWQNEEDRDLIDTEEVNFDNLITGKALIDFIYLKPSQLEKVIYEKGKESELLELLDDEKVLRAKLLNRKAISDEHKRLELECIKEIEKQIIILNSPRFPEGREPRDYQIEAYKKWKGNKNSFKGIFAMATGTGKTITALNCVLNCFHEFNHYKVIILVPTTILLSQWVIDAKKFNFNNIFTSHDNDWEERLKNYIFLEKLGQKNNYVFIITYSTFNRPSFQNIVKNKKLDETILIADEAHNLGSGKSLSNLLWNVGKRIGLSATPSRKYDEEGSVEVEKYFESYGPCYTYSYTMSKAIENKVLTKYLYFPYFVKFTPDESKVYAEISRELLLKHFDFSKNIYKKSAAMLLIKRKRVIHQAKNKKIAVEKILKEIISRNNGEISHMLVYVPEGYEPDYSENENYDIDIEDKRIIDEYSEIISKLGITTHQILGETKERTKLLEQFEDGIISTLTAMKTLDEGVDIPATKYAIFCASTGNERQFIQRRGRILRNFPGKEFAYVYDIIIEPNESLWENEHIDLIDKIKKNEVNAFKSEIGRVANFLYCCHNLDDIFISKDENYIKLMSLCEKYDIPLQTNIIELKNNDKNC